MDEMICEDVYFGGRVVRARGAVVNGQYVPGCWEKRRGRSRHPRVRWWCRPTCSFGRLSGMCGTVGEGFVVGGEECLARA